MANNTTIPQPIKTVFRYEVSGERLTSDKLVFFVLIFFVFSILAQSLLILVNWNELPPEVPLFYSRSWGELMLVRPIMLWILPGFTLIFTFLNYFIALYFKNRYYFLNRVLIYFSALLGFISLYDLARIVKLLV